MPKIDADFSKVETERRCAKCRSVELINRHHTGCERMWLRHFRAKSGTKEYKAFKARYESFHKDDCIPLCTPCHRLIHDIYFVIICLEVNRLGIPARDWSWKRAEKLMSKLRQACNLWLEMKPFDAE